MDKIKIYVYTLCWNEELIIPYFLRHYETIATRIFVYDNGSTDKSIELLSAHPLVTIIPFDTGGVNNSEITSTIKNNAWKKYRYISNWVIVCDMDEFLWHPDLLSYLHECSREKITIPHVDGFDMVSTFFPDPISNHNLLNKYINRGFFTDSLCKSLIFNPRAIQHMNYRPGGHFCYPVGLVNNIPVTFESWNNIVPESIQYFSTHYKQRCNSDLKLLHFKNMGYDFFLQKYGRLKNRPYYNPENGYMIKLDITRIQFDTWIDQLNDSIEVVC